MADADEVARDEELSTREDVKEHLLDLYADVMKGFNEQAGRANDIQDYWDIYNCELSGNQFYNGNSQIFVPIVHNAVNARKVRFSNQIFPQSGRYVEVTTGDGKLPHATTALLEYYVRKAKLRAMIPALVVNGDVEGQYSVYVHWAKNERYVTKKTQKPVQNEELEMDDPDEEVEDVEIRKVVHQYPVVEVLADADLLVLPQTADNIGEAIQNGGSVTVLRRWTKAKLKKMIASGDMDTEAAKGFVEELSQDNTNARMDKAKKMVDAAGINKDGRGKFALIYETWSKVEVEDGEWRLCRTYFAGPDSILSCKRNPLWSDKIPIHSAPVDKVQGAFKGISKIKAVADLQYFANDTTNEAADSAAFSMLPITMTDPEKNPRVGSMVLSLGAIWETSPKDTQFAQFPAMWKEGMEIVGVISQQIMQTLAVNPAQITQGQSKGGKQSQASIANEQQIDLLTTADAVTVLETSILTPMLETMFEMDQQYRDEPVLVQQFGNLGIRANMEEIPPIQFDRHYQFRWYGVEAARTAQQMQQQISAINVLRGIPPQMYQGYRLDISPAITQLVEGAFGPRLAPLIFIDIRSELSTNPEMENELLEEGMEMPVHPLDNHAEHMKVHLPLLKKGDPHGTIRAHLLKHQAMQAQAAQAQVDASKPKGGPGSPGGQGPGVPGSPQPGSQPAPPRGGQQPPGAVPQDQMPAGAMPRRM
jgi:hypothetical protein